MIYRFERYVLDTDRHVLTLGGDPVELEPQVFDLLHLLVRNAGDLVTKDQIIEDVWGGRIVSESAISARVSAVRSAVGDTGKSQSIIKTVTRRGLQFVASVCTDDKQAAEFDDAKQRVKFARSADGTGVAYAVSGEGPVLVRAGHFLTHLECDWSSVVWRPYLDAFSQAHTLVRYDQRGTGMSDRALAGAELDHFVEDLLAVVDGEGLEKFPLAGWSQGVAIAVRFAALYPERVSCLVLYGGYALGRSLRGDGTQIGNEDVMRAMMQEGWGKPESAFMAAFTSLFCPSATKEQLSDLVEMQLASATAADALEMRQTIDRFDVVDDLARVRAPSLVLHSHNDSVHPLSQGQMLASRIKGAELLVLQSDNHIPIPNDPAWADIIGATLEFVARHQGEQRAE